MSAKDGAFLLENDMGGLLFLGGIFGGIIASVFASAWSYDYDFIQEANNVAVETCGEDNVKSISFGNNKINCKDGRSITWSSK